MVGVEPASMTAVFCINARDRAAETWKKQLEPFSHLEFAVSDAAKQQGADARGRAQSARTVWRQATMRFEQAERLDLFGPHGQLTDRARAETEITAAWKDLIGPDWGKVRNVLRDPRSLAFLDRMHRRLEEAEPRPQWREALARRWWLRHRQPKASAPLTALVWTVGRDRPLTVEEQASYDRVALVLRGTFRPSSAAEYMNSMLRMQQARHRRLTQLMLDLKRLYLELPAVPLRPMPERLPVPSTGSEVAHL